MSNREPAARQPWPVVRGDLEGLDQLDPTDPTPLVMFCWSDVRPLQGVSGFVDWRLCGALSRTIEDGIFAGAAGEDLCMPADGRLGRRSYFMLGLGPIADGGEQVFEVACRRAEQVTKRAGVQSFVLVAQQDREGSEASFLAAAGRVFSGHGSVSAVLVEHL